MNQDPSHQNAPANQPASFPNPLERSDVAFEPQRQFKFLLEEGQRQLSKGDSLGAESILRQALEMARETHDTSDHNLVQALDDYAHCCILNNKPGTAERLLIELIEISKRHPDEYAAQGVSSSINICLLKISTEDFPAAAEWSSAAVAQVGNNPNLSQWKVPSLLAHGLALELKGDVGAADQCITEAFLELSSASSTPRMIKVAKHLTLLSSVFADKLDFDHALKCVDAIVEMTAGLSSSDGVSMHLKALGTRSNIEHRMGNIRDSFETEQRFVEIAMLRKVKSEDIFPQRLSLAQKMIEFGDLEGGDAQLAALAEQARSGLIPSHLKRAVSWAQTRSLYIQGAFTEAKPLLEAAIEDLMSSLPEPVRNLIIHEPERILDDLAETIMKFKPASEIIKDLDQLVPLLAQQWHISQAEENSVSTPVDLETCLNLIEVLRKEGMRGNLQYFKMLFIDNLDTHDRVARLDDLLSDKHRLNSREELGLRVAAAIENAQINQHEEGREHLDRATLLYEKLIANSDSLNNVEAVNFYASALAQYGEHETAFRALQRMYLVLKQTGIQAGPEYHELLKEIAERGAMIEHRNTKDYEIEAERMRKRLIKNNPGYSFL